MKYTWTARILVAVIFAVLLGFLLGASVHHNLIKQNQLGRDAFIAYQSSRFDRSMVHPHSALVYIAVSVFLFGLFFAVYEMVSAGAVFGLKAITSSKKVEVKEQA
jgi:Na+/H+ antiporter NhaD/arsenite permease-like protein